MVLAMYFSARGIPIYLYNKPSEEIPWMMAGWLSHANVDALSHGDHTEKYKRVFAFIKALSKKKAGLMKLELGCGTVPSAGYVHHDRKRHSPHVDVVHDLNELPWPWEDESCEEILALDVFEHLHLMPEQWLRECHRILVSGGVLRLRVPVFGSPWHLMDPTHVRGFDPLNFDYFIHRRILWQKYGHYYFEFAFQEGETQIEGHNIVATLKK